MKVSELDSALKLFRKSLRFWEGAVKSDLDYINLNNFYKTLNKGDDRNLTKAELFSLAQILLGSEKQSERRDVRVTTLINSLMFGMGMNVLAALRPLHQLAILDRVSFDYIVDHSPLAISIADTFEILRRNKLLEYFKDKVCQNVNNIIGLYDLILMLDKAGKLTKENLTLVFKNSQHVYVIIQAIKSIVKVDEFNHYFQTAFSLPLRALNILNLISDLYQSKKLLLSKLHLDILIKNEIYIENIISALHELKVEQNLFTNENINRIFANPQFSKEIVEVLAGGFGLIPSEKIKNYLLKNIHYWRQSIDALAVVGHLIEVEQLKLHLTDFFLQSQYATDVFNTFTELRNDGFFKKRNPIYHDLIQTILKNPQYAKDIAAGFQLLFTMKNDGKKYLPIIYKHPYKLQNLLISLHLLQEEKILSDDVLRIIFNDLENADIFMKAFILLHQKQFDLNKYCNQMGESPTLCKLITILAEAGLITQQSLDALFFPQGTNSLFSLPEPSHSTLGESDEQAKANLIDSLKKIHHPFSYFFLGKFYCGELWGITKNISFYGPQKESEMFQLDFEDAKIASDYFRLIPKSHPWHEEALRSLYHVSLNFSGYKHPNEIEKRYHVSKHLAALDDPTGKAVQRSYELFKNAHVAQLKINGSWMSFFNPTANGQIHYAETMSNEIVNHAKMQKDWIIENRHKSEELMKVYNQHYGLVLRK